MVASSSIIACYNLSQTLRNKISSHKNIWISISFIKKKVLKYFIKHDCILCLSELLVMFLIIFFKWHNKLKISME
jgi:hypothetical protein